MHALCNCYDKISTKESPLFTFSIDLHSLSGEERGKKLTSSNLIRNVHSSVAEMGEKVM